MKIVQFSAIDGGVGKSTLCFNFAEYLAFEGYKVLLVDKDHQAKITQLYGIKNQTNTVANIYKESGEVDIQNVKPNIDIIKGYINLDNVEDSLTTVSYKNMFFYDWLRDNRSSKNLDQYDYMVIDTHSDFRIASKNAATVSHAIIAPVRDSDHTDSAHLEFKIEDFRKENINFSTRESYVKAKLLRIGSILEHNTDLSIKFKEKIENDERYVTYFPKRSIFNKSMSDGKSISQKHEDNELNRNEKQFMKEYKERMNMLKQAVDDAYQEIENA